MVVILILFLLAFLVGQYIRSRHKENNGDNRSLNLKENTETKTEKIADPFPKNLIISKIEKLSFNGNNLDECLDYIKTRLAIIKELDQELKVFGARKWQYTFRKVSEEEINSLEKESGKQLPLEFKAFLLEIGFGAAPGIGVNREAVLKVDELIYNPEIDDEDDKIFANGYIVVTEYELDIEARLCLDSKHFGEIWRCDLGCMKVSDNYIDWYIKWINFLLYVFAVTEFISINTLDDSLFIETVQRNESKLELNLQPELNKLTIQLPALTDHDALFRIYDRHARKEQHVSIINLGGQKYEADIATLYGGLYVLQVSDSKNYYCKLFVIMR